MNFVPKSMYMRKRVSGPSYREAAVHAQNSGTIALTLKAAIGAMASMGLHWERRRLAG
jgi:hypothetical protein